MTNTPESIAARAGHVPAKLLALAAAIALVITAIYMALYAASRTLACRDNLTRIFEALEIHEMTHGALPHLAFYPAEPLTDTESICIVLEAYGIDPSTWICPSAPDVMTGTGLTYIWNTRLNGRSLRNLGERQWMLMELHGLDQTLPGPHFRSCNVLFTDGTVERVRNPAESIARW